MENKQMESALVNVRSDSGAFMGCATPPRTNAAETADEAAAGNHTEPTADAAKYAGEHEYWRKEYLERPYFTHGTSYDQYGPAYQYGWESQAAHPEKKFDDVETELGREWDSLRGSSKLGWDLASVAARDAWNRAEKATCSDACDE